MAEAKINNYIKQLEYKDRLEILKYAQSCQKIKDDNVIALFLKSSTSKYKSYIIRHILSFTPIKKDNIIPFRNCEHFELFKHFSPTHEQKQSTYYHGKYTTIEGNFTVHVQENKSSIFSRPNWVTHVESATLIEFYTAMGEFSRPNPKFYMIILTTPDGEKKTYALNFTSKCPLIIENLTQTIF
jgi:hypothetical protein